MMQVVIARTADDSDDLECDILVIYRRLDHFADRISVPKELLGQILVDNNHRFGSLVVPNGKVATVEQWDSNCGEKSWADDVHIGINRSAVGCTDGGVRGTAASVRPLLGQSCELNSGKRRHAPKDFRGEDPNALAIVQLFLRFHSEE